MNGTIDEAARAAGWDGSVSLTEFIKTMGADLSRVQRCNAELIEDAETHKEQERRLKRELAEARAEIAKVRHAYNQQHDVWEELYVKDGLKRLRERAAAYDIIWAQLDTFVKMIHDERERVLQHVDTKERLFDKMATALSRISGKAADIKHAIALKHLEPSVGEMSFAQRLEYFAKEAVKPPAAGAVTSRPALPDPSVMDLVQLPRSVEALRHLLVGMCRLSAGSSTFDDVRNRAHEAWLLLEGVK